MRLRRTRLYMPGNRPRLFAKGPAPDADSVILDLEDAVPPAEKDSSRVLVRYALENVNWGGVELLVRINPLSTPFGRDDVKEVAHLAHGLIVPKSEKPSDVQQVAAMLDEIEAERGLPAGKIALVPLIETARGVLNAVEVARASPRNISLAFGAEDYTADVGGERTNEGSELFFARSMIVAAAKAAGIQASDTVFGDFRDMDGLYREARQAAAMGFDGKGAIHPNQLAVIIRAFTPDAKRIEYAKRVMDAIKKAEATGSSVAALGGKMIDPPVRARAEKVLALARAAGALKE
jgi:citrate lyase subunit beta/citryl-CoA lyase